MNQYSGLEGKVAIVTGASSGIGEVVTRTLHGHGCKLVLAGRRENLLSDLANELPGSVAIPVDVSIPESAKAMVDACIDAFGRLDIAVNNAGTVGDGVPTGEFSIEGWRRVISVNLNGVFYCMRYEIPAMLASGGGSIINTASILGLVGNATSSAYTAAKHGVLGLSQTAAIEYAEQGIRVNSVCPAFVETAMVAAWDDAAINRKHPMNRLGKPQEVADVISFLASDDASFVTGASYLVDGGYTAW